MEKQLRGVLECSQEHLYLNQEQAQTLPWLVNVPLILVPLSSTKPRLSLSPLPVAFGQKESAQPMSVGQSLEAVPI